MVSKRQLSWFFVRMVMWVIVLMVAWSQVSRWTSIPVGWVSAVVLKVGAPDWVQSVAQMPGLIEVQTRLEVVSDGRKGDLILDASTSHFAYGLPIIWALLLAAGGAGRWRGRAWRMAVAYVALWPAQAFSVCMDLLKRLAIAAPGGTRTLGVAQWQMEALALGYQLGVLIVPTLVPILLWVWLDQRYVKDLIAPYVTPRA
jgi:hypothetical protein